jgi:UDPglucose 6-dehydrogenase
MVGQPAYEVGLSTLLLDDDLRHTCSEAHFAVSAASRDDVAPPVGIGPPFTVGRVRRQDHDPLWSPPYVDHVPAVGLPFGTTDLRRPAGPMRVGVVGAGHVGLISAVCLASIGRRVFVQDIDQSRIQLLSAGSTPFLEPGLTDLLTRGLAEGLLSFHTDPAEAFSQVDLTFICVDTPNNPDGSLDLRAVVAAARSLARHAREDSVLVNRSTAPVGTAQYVRSMVEEERRDSVTVAVNPEFTAEGTAVRDFLRPDRIVIGAWDERSAEVIREVYEPILSGRTSIASGGSSTVPPEPVPLVLTDPPTAELAKYASNAFLAVRISLINELASIAEEVGGDVVRIAEAVGLDHRIGPHFLAAGVGWGGSCFPKDIIALQGMAETRGLAARMLRAANEVNLDQHQWVIRRLQRRLRTLVGRRVGLLGLSFKPGTDDLRNAPSLDIARELGRVGARVRAFDPAVTSLPEAVDWIDLVDDPLALADGAEALVLVTEWPQFRDLDLAHLREVMRVPLLLDGRNFLDPERAAGAGFEYIAVGRADPVTADNPPLAPNGHQRQPEAVLGASTGSSV